MIISSAPLRYQECQDDFYTLLIAAILIAIRLDLCRLVVGSIQLVAGFCVLKIIPLQLGGNFRFGRY